MSKKRRFLMTANITESGFDRIPLARRAKAFTANEQGWGMVLKSGFDRIPLARRAKAFTANEQGWGMVVKLIEEYLVNAP